MSRRKQTPKDHSTSAPSHTKGRRNAFKLLPLTLAAVIIVAAAGFLLLQPDDAHPSPTADVELAPVSLLSAKARSAPPIVQEAYRFAVANPEVLSQYPCYCGCGNMGHGSNLDCFVQEFREDGSVVFDDHAFG